MNDHQQRDAAAIVEAALARLDDAGLIDRDEDGLATLSVAGLTTLHDLVTVLTVNTTGDGLPEHVRLTHDIGAVYLQALNLWMFGNDADPGARADAKRHAIAAIKRAARTYSY
jgi:hypothetical protein